MASGVNPYVCEMNDSGSLKPWLKPHYPWMRRFLPIMITVAHVRHNEDRTFLQHVQESPSCAVLQSSLVCYDCT